MTPKPQPKKFGGNTLKYQEMSKEELVAELESRDRGAPLLLGLLCTADLGGRACVGWVVGHRERGRDSARERDRAQKRDSVRGGRDHKNGRYRHGIG